MMTREAPPNEDPNHRQLVNALRRKLIRIGSDPSSVVGESTLSLLAAVDGRIKLGPMPVGTRASGRAPLTDDLNELAAYLSTPKAQVVLQTVLDDTFCGAVLLHPVFRGAEGENPRTANSGLAAIAVSLLSADDEAMVVYEPGTRTSQEVAIDDDEGTRQLLAALWNVVTAIDDSLAAQMPPEAAKIAMEMFLQGGDPVSPGSHRRDGDVDLMQGLNGGGPWRSISGSITAAAAGQCQH